MRAFSLIWLHTALAEPSHLDKLPTSPSSMASLDAYPATVHEFCIPSKALLSLHSYYLVHFDVFHAVLVDLSVHIALLKDGTSTPQKHVSHGKKKFLECIMKDPIK